MKQKTLIVLFTMAICSWFLSGCKQDPETVLEGGQTISVNIYTADSVSVGNHSIDIDRDGTADITIWDANPHYMASNHPGNYMVSVAGENIFLAAYPRTLYINDDIDTLYPPKFNATDTVEMHSTGYSFVKGKTTVSQSDINMPAIYNYGDLISSNTKWSKEVASLSSRGFWPSSGNRYSKNYYQYYLHSRDYNAYSVNDYYLGFKVVKKRKTRYGWIHIMSGTKPVEFAIQR